MLKLRTYSPPHRIMPLSRQPSWDVNIYDDEVDYEDTWASQDDEAHRGNGMSCDNGKVPSGASTPTLAGTPHTQSGSFDDELKMHLGGTPSWPPSFSQPYPSSQPSSQSMSTQPLDEEEMFAKPRRPLQAEDTLMSVVASSQDEPLTAGARPAIRRRSIILTRLLPRPAKRSCGIPQDGPAVAEARAHVGRLAAQPDGQH